MSLNEKGGRYSISSPTYAVNIGDQRFLMKVMSKMKYVLLNEKEVRHFNISICEVVFQFIYITIKKII